MESAAKKNQRLYYLFRLACIVGGVIIPTLVSSNFAAPLHNAAKAAAILISLIVAVSAAIMDWYS